ncbi:TrkH family potassium uptake protein [Bariatricus massiliensis]|uniref:TrkH family potassium uptake protein n=1 Tax=Bariatricus massiliensis TaxID=1745713 RepID=A0ABS8DK64_9FIRM|nr:potassium transporter TrkG [Bariatricus massiliensis]MCB7305114.1 TrkH family potassium uptake protein [Bariatricus massiliensis]MCB7375545.1 TrkH family potassium uptake protein [Bariatricus massiliensis]MCB7388134.1 TrkH family potassium uptake protein [Bariatricus massiliensis]MCB7412430.1 TrkH family potassium uptake protein [Bariatricus massiliensis]MCQ5254586.1 TrkH family potassium uptake protein [Bariatricus massiliensis]
MLHYKKKSSGLVLIVHYIGAVAIVIGCILLVPLIMLIPFPQEIGEAKYFIIPGTLCIAAGYFLFHMREEKYKWKNYKNKENIIVTLAWIMVILLSSVPFVLTGKYNFTQAIFECTSGYSTTGLSVVDVAKTSHIFLFFRSVMLFVGGIGLVLVVITVLSDRYGMKLFEAEGHSDKMVPNLLQSARVIFLIYSGYIAGGTVLYIAFGMNWFDAVNHAVAAISTGGFSTQAESIGYYHNTGIEVVTIVLMFLGGTNFMVHLALLKGKFRKVYTDCEFRFSLFVYPLSAVLLAVLAGYPAAKNMSEGVRMGLFQAVSAMSTTGFQTVDSFKSWSSPMIFIMIMLMMIGGGAGSTAGGIKQYRVSIAVKEIFWNLRKKIGNKRTIVPEKITRCGEPIEVDGQLYRSNMDFIFLYIIFMGIGTMIFTCFGYSVQDSMFEMASSLSTVGLSMGITGYDAHPLILWTSTIGMFLGRLEIYIVFITAARACIGIKNKLKHTLSTVV